MKRAFTFMSLILFCITSFSQQVAPKPLSTKDEFQIKSKKQKNIAWILAAGGAALITAALLIPKGDVDGWSPVTFKDTYEHDDTKAILGLLGAGCIGGSIPLFIASGKNKRRANDVSVSLKSSNASILRTYSLVKINYPVVAIRMSF